MAWQASPLRFRNSLRVEPRCWCVPSRKIRPPNCEGSFIPPNRATKRHKRQSHKRHKIDLLFCAFCPFLWQSGFMRVHVNGESRELSASPSLADLITQLDLPATRIAVELNREV